MQKCRILGTLRARIVAVITNITLYTRPDNNILKVCEELELI